ncbi:LamG domain-containing protein [Candidatus Poribacteria bacterium]
MSRMFLFFVFAFVIFVTFPAIVSMADLAEDLVAHWAFEGDATDSSGNGNDGTILGNPAWVDGPKGFGQALSFDGVDDHITLGTGPAMNGPTDFTLALWVKSDSGGEHTFIQQRMAGATGYVGQYILSMGTAHNSPLAPGQVYFMVYNGDFQWEIKSSKTINDGDWHFVAGVRSGETGTLYIDGEPDGTETTPIRDLNNTIEVAIGRDIRDGGQYHKGVLDEIVIYERALFLNELKQLSEKGPRAAVEPAAKLVTVWGALKQ